MNIIEFIGEATEYEKNGKDIVRVGFAEYEHLLLWRKLSAKYICIEPWTNLPDPDGVPDVEFSTKAGVIKVEGGQVKKMVHTIEYL